MNFASSLMLMMLNYSVHDSAVAVLLRMQTVLCSVQGVNKDSYLILETLPQE